MPTIQIERQGRAAYLTIDRPPLNVLDIATLNELCDTLAALRSDDALRVLVLTGAGRCFSAGVDVADHTPERVPAMLDAVTNAIRALFTFPAPTVALVHGHVLGGGLELALACDTIVARRGATLGLPEIKLGVFAPYAAILLPPLVGRQVALDLLYTGRSIDIEEAARIGLVQKILSEEEDPSLAELIQALEAHSASALRLTKRAVLETLGLRLEEALHTVNRLYCDTLMQTHDAHEGLAAFIEKRPPRWHM
ncbi:MAG: 3-hydroxybutyryl-CoA dehydratase [Herpetosiphonaceae bacterium]|nr:MAG: 3-hydroxybutyryl-CoA dehydratase [Herpetosiphonaceae bacterium]